MISSHCPSNVDLLWDLVDVVRIGFAASDHRDWWIRRDDLVRQARIHVQTVIAKSFLEVGERRVVGVLICAEALGEATIAFTEGPLATVIGSYA